MKRNMQIWQKVAGRGAFGFLILELALCFGLGSARAGSLRNTHVKSRAEHKTKSAATASKARLRSASYKTKTTVHKRRRRRRRHHVTLPKGPSAARTEQIQSALGRGGYYSGDPTGKWDSNTEESLRRFQSANGLPPTGKLDSLSLQKMGLGSDVAGVSAPRTVTPADSATSSSASTPPKNPGQ